ncbi:MAG: TIGR00159 family protein, partial [Verrucomicrobia bacterium]|nr:TIGR00159 family protein [Verrucomicrobiota bacterium]NDE99899.1 TIGR00159 family protein [Verrucomicrobiota bacterium]
MALELLNNIWRPALEILILAVGIYYAANFIRGTRGAPVVTGLVVLLVSLTFITTVLELTVLRGLLTWFFSFSAIGVVVIFQPELRRLLAELGNQSLLLSAREQREDVEVIVETVERLADVRIGALMAMEQSINLAEAVESGIVVDCEATPEMLETIFFPNNAIHDGGVILKNGRILRAACIFPLTHRHDLHKSLGTRHRAAIGLSEETDAVIVIVSEESGAISYAYRGELRRGVTAEELRAFLTSIFVQRVRARNWVDHLRLWLAQNISRSSSAKATASAPVPPPSN